MLSLESQYQAIPISIIDMLVSLAVAFACGLWAVLVYRLSHRGLTYERSFLVTLLMVAPIVGLVIMLIGSNLALSLGMVGALSIIRFRTVIKDSRDMVYLFWTIAIGLGSGTDNWVVIAVASVVIGLVLLGLHFLQYGKAQHGTFVMVTQGSGDKPSRQVQETLAGSAVEATLRNLEIRETGWEMVLEIRFFNEDPAFHLDLLEQVRALPSVERASLLAPHLTLPV